MAFQLNKTFTADKANKGVEFEYIDPSTGECTGAFVTMYGLESKSYRNYQTEKSRKKLAEKKRDTFQTAEDQHAEAVEMFVALFASWRGFVDSDGKDVNPDKDTVYLAFDQSEPLRSQALAAITAPASFLPSA